MAEKFLLIFCAVSLSACSLSGVQYQPPTELQDSAKLTGSSLKIINFSTDGCFSGMTAFDDNIKIHANKEVVIAFEAYPQTNFFCQFIFSLTPRKNETYFVRQASSNERTNQSIWGALIVRPYCNIDVEKRDENGSYSNVPFERLRLRPRGIACLKAEPY